MSILKTRAPSEYTSLGVAKPGGRYTSPGLSSTGAYRACVRSGLAGWQKARNLLAQEERHEWHSLLDQLSSMISALERRTRHRQRSPSMWSALSPIFPDCDGPYVRRASGSSAFCVSQLQRSPLLRLRPPHPHLFSCSPHHA